MQNFDGYQKAAQATNYPSPNSDNSVKIKPPQPLTIASALSRMEELNEQIAHISARLSSVAGLLGALHPTESKGRSATQPGNVVARLNDEADKALSEMSEITGLVSGIERALG